LIEADIFPPETGKAPGLHKAQDWPLLKKIYDIIRVRLHETLAGLEVELGGDKELDGGKLKGEGVGQGGPNHRMGVRGCLPG
jgi:hypothetical protein